MLIRVTAGEVHVLGSRLTADGKCHYIMSPSSTSLLVIENMQQYEAKLELQSVWNGLDAMMLSCGDAVLGVVHSFMAGLLFSSPMTLNSRFCLIPSATMLC